MWSSSSGPSRPINYGFPPEMGMLGLRDVFLVAPAAAYHNHPHHHHHHHHPPHHQQDLLSSDHNSMNGSNPATALGVGVGVIPLLTTTPCLGPSNTNMNDDNDDDDDHNMLSGRNRNSAGGGGGSIHLWQQPTQQQHQLFLKKNQNLHGGAHLMVQGGGGGNFGASAASASASASSALTCQDCGNQAKKDCNHRRCRTCCKSRGFDCTTHVKSTWVPAARRRERQLMSEGVAAAGSSASTSHTNNTSSNAKKPRLVTSQNTTPSHTNSTSNTTPPRSYDSTSKLQRQDGGFPETMPGQVRAPAVFKCVRVTAVDDGAEDEYAYHAVVKINGHVFKGFLYDQGVEGQGRDHHGFPNISDLHLGGRSGGATSTPTGRNGGAPILDPADAYAAAAAAASTSGGLLLGVSNFGNSIN